MRPSPPAATRLRTWRTERGLSLAKAAKQLGVSAPTWYDWERDEKRPRSALRNAIELLTGIPAADWDTLEERAVVDRVRAELGAESPDAVTVEPPPKSSARQPAVTKKRAGTRPGTAKIKPKRRAARRVDGVLDPTGT